MTSLGREGGTGPMGCHPVALHLDQGDRGLHPQVILDAIFPSLMEKPVRVCPIVFQEVIAILVAVFRHPSPCRLDGRPQIGDEPSVSRAAVVFGGHDEKERRAVGGPGVREISVRTRLPRFWSEAML